MKKKIFLVFIVLFGMIGLTGCVKIKSNLDNNDSQNTSNIDDNILVFLKEQNVINSQDIYKSTYSEIGLYGAGDKEYIYERNDGSYYVIDIDSFSYSKAGDYRGYSYEAYETFYVVKIQDCDYNEDAKYIDQTISKRDEEIDYYIISNKDNNFELITIS